MPTLVPSSAAASDFADALASRYRAVRGLTLALAEPLSDADATVQSMPDASPAKWHMAHTTWFFETFVLRDHVPDYGLHDPRFPFLFNSYYEAEGKRHARHRRGMITRPTLDEVRAYRAHVDAALLAALPDLPAEALELVALGCHHEEQHQELFVTDILHLFSENPLEPALYTPEPKAPVAMPGPIGWIEGKAGIVEVGHDGQGFAFDCEGPRHQALLQRHAIADRTVTNAEWMQFIDDGGWTRFGLDGRRPIDPAAPVTHVSFYEADAFATWAGARLPTEFEWEAAAASHDASGGNQMEDAGAIEPRPSSGGPAFFGDVWEWTGSAYRPYPGFHPVEGAVGEYNGKFMNGQFVLRGGSCATPRGHARACYRNFFYPHQRWQFTGVRLAKDL